MKSIFESSDFITAIDFREQEALKIICDLANAKINKIIESWPVVVRSKSFNWVEESYPESTTNELKARLAFVEEIVKEPCLHEPKVIYHHHVIEYSAYEKLKAENYQDRCKIQYHININDEMKFNHENEINFYKAKITKLRDQIKDYEQALQEVTMFIDSRDIMGLDIAETVLKKWGRM